MDHKKILDEDAAMTLAQLYDQLAPSLHKSRKDIQTALRVLATALHCPDPQHCFPEHYHQPLPTLIQMVDEHLRTQEKGVSTIRNTKNYIRRLFRLAEAQHLVSLAPAPLTPRYDPRYKPNRPGSTLSRPNGASLLYRHWPVDLQEAFTAFETWATAPVYQGRPASLWKRPGTVQDYRRFFEGYFGYLHHIANRVPIFNDLFDFELVSAYVHWHVSDYHQRPTAAIYHFLNKILALTRQYRPNEALCAQLKALQRELPVIHPVYDKNDAWVSLDELEQVGSAIWPRKQPHQLSQSPEIPGLYYAPYAGLSLMLRLWTWIPYRQRNMREMRLGDNLHQDSQGHWRIIFRGEQLKIAAKRGKINVFDRQFPQALVPDLEAYLTIWRPLLLRKVGHPDTHVFLTKRGAPYNRHVLRLVTSGLVYRYTGKHWHPHIIRTVWATEWIRGGGDFLTAAQMLNDTIETVIDNYSHLRDNNVDEEVYATLTSRRHNNQGK
jgi:hypothetical protein